MKPASLVGIGLVLFALMLGCRGGEGPLTTVVTPLPTSAPRSTSPAEVVTPTLPGVSSPTPSATGVPPSPQDASTPTALVPSPQLDATPTPGTIPTVSIPPTASPALPAGTPTPHVQVVTFGLLETFELVAGQAARLEGTNVEVLLVEAHGPRPGCFDCPNTAVLRVGSGDESQELAYSFSGLMTEAALEKARRKAAFGLVFMLVKVFEGGVALRVEPEPQ